MGNKRMLVRSGGQEPGSHTAEEKGAEAVGDQEDSWTSEVQAKKNNSG